jgi:hypothetical protein
MSNLMSGGAITRTSAFSGLKRRLTVCRAGMAASFSTGTSVRKRQDRLQGRSRQVRSIIEQEDQSPWCVGQLSTAHCTWAQLQVHGCVCVCVWEGKAEHQDIL